jgi:hypothetical protein
MGTRGLRGGVRFAVVVLICVAPGPVAASRPPPAPPSHPLAHLDLEQGVATRNGRVVADPAGDRLILLGPRGRIRTLTVFPTRLLDAGPGGPGGRPIRLRSVPSVVVRGPDGAFYVGELTSFPYPRGKARVWRVVPGRAPTVYASGFTAIRGLAFGPGEQLFVRESVRPAHFSDNPSRSPATPAGESGRAVARVSSSRTLAGSSSASVRSRG